MHQVPYETRPGDNGGVQMVDQRPTSNGAFSLGGGSGHGSNHPSSSRYLNVDDTLVQQNFKDNQAPFALGVSQPSQPRNNADALSFQQQMQSDALRDIQAPIINLSPHLRPFSDQRALTPQQDDRLSSVQSQYQEKRPPLDSTHALERQSNDSLYQPRVDQL